MTEERTRSIACLLACAAAALTSSAASAQVNIEPFRARLADERLGGNLNAQISGRAGNSEGLTVGASGLFGGRTSRHFAFVVATTDYSRLNEETQVEKYFVHTRYNLSITDRIVGEAFGQLEHDAFQRLTLRRVLGAGPRVEIFQGDLTFFVGTAYMLERETIHSDADDAGEDLEMVNHRWSNSFNLLWIVDDRVTLSTSTLYQPKFNDFYDFRILSVNQANFSVTDILTAGLIVTYRYDSRPPRDVLRSDATIQNSLGLTF